MDNNKKIFVANLAWEIKDEDLANIFSVYGRVLNASVILDRITGKSRGFGFVEFENEDHANEAIKSMNGVLVKGRSLKVNVAIPKSNTVASQNGQ